MSAGPVVRLRVGLAGPYARVTGAREVEVELGAPATPARLLAALAERWPGLRPLADLPDDEWAEGVLVVCAGRIVERDEPLPDGAAVRVVPPLVGGAAGRASGDRGSGR